MRSVASHKPGQRSGQDVAYPFPEPVPCCGGRRLSAESRAAAPLRLVAQPFLRRVKAVESQPADRDHRKNPVGWSTVIGIRSRLQGIRAWASQPPSCGTACPFQEDMQVVAISGFISSVCHPDTESKCGVLTSIRHVVLLPDHNTISTKVGKYMLECQVGASHGDASFETVLHRVGPDASG